MDSGGAMQVVVAGGTGFLGREVVRQALEAGHHVFPLIRDDREASFDPEAIHEGRLVPLPFGAPAEVLQAGFGLEPGAWIINAAGLLKEVPRTDPHVIHRMISDAVVELAQDNQAQRLVHFGPLISPTVDAFTHSKVEMEERVKASGVPWSVVRSAPLFGIGDALLDEIGAWMSRSPIIPRFLEDVSLQPVHVVDAAQALLLAPPGLHEIGGEKLLWGELLALCAQAAGKRLLGPRLSEETVLRLARALGNHPAFSPLVPFNEAGFRRHRLGYTVTGNTLERLLGRPPLSLAEYLATLWPYRA
jgi:uncharacterized protein YbjT (DUF2867 family)